MIVHRRLVASAVVALGLLAAACSSDSSTAPTATPVLGAAASATSSSAVRITFNSKAGDTGYNVERAEGATGSFAQVGTVAAPSTPGSVSYTDTGLKVSTLYRYRLVTVRGSLTSTPSGEFSVTTLAHGFAAADITGDITTSRTLYADTTYTLKGFIHVANGATLTIQPGTTIKGDFNTLGSSLFILRGAKIQAVGTAAAPIVMTSSRAVGQRQTGDWGGLIIVGNGLINRSGSVELEGSNTDGVAVVSGKNYQVLYSGGTTPTDNSGTLAYVRVEFAGFAPSLNNELNSFSFGAVGSGTRISYLQAMAGLDDSYEFWGGSVDGDHLVSYEAGDDHFDMSEGFSGRLQYLISLQSTVLTPRTGAGSPSSDPQGIENDGCAGSGCDLAFNSTPLTIPVVANFTLIGTGSTTTSGSSGGTGMVLRRGTGGYYVNGVVARFPRGGIGMRDLDTFVRAGSAATPDLATTDLAVRNVLVAETNSIVFETGSGRSAFDLAGNTITASAATAATLFTALPATGVEPTLAGLDWSPATGSAIAAGGLATFTGKLATKAGTFVTGTTYLGAAAPGGTKWWTGWTVYFKN
ncbi:MAG: fibronectin type III domain-containing protein [Gemmatimonadaceae bacterium]|nr:fibronectin type III domain-containing protein [Gemmatimonadaceae bacterium]